MNFAGVAREASAPDLPAGCAEGHGTCSKVCVLTFQPTSCATSVPARSLAVCGKAPGCDPSSPGGGFPPACSPAAVLPAGSCWGGQRGAAALFRSAGACPLKRVYPNAPKNHLQSIEMEADCFSSARKGSKSCTRGNGLEWKAFVSSQGLVPAGE